MNNQEIINSAEIKFAEGSRLLINNLSDSHLFITVNRDKNSPFMAADFFSPNTYRHYFYENYCEYYIKVYKITNSGWDIEFLFDKQISYENKNVLFRLIPESEEDCRVWIKYIAHNFKNAIKCNCFIDCEMDLKDIIEFYNLSRYDSNLDYYLEYKISRNPKSNMNILGVNNKTSYEIINNCLLRL